MSFAPGDRVHLAGLGTGIVRESRGTRRYAIDIKGRIVIAAEADLEPAMAPRQRGRGARLRTRDAPVPDSRIRPAAPGGTLDLHGLTVDEATAAIETFINDALLGGAGEVRVIHGKSGGKIKSSLHSYLRRLPIVVDFRIDPRNAGVTIVTFG